MTFHLTLLLERPMHDTLTHKQRHHCMAANRGKNTGPEFVVRSALHRLGFRYSLYRTDLPGRPDITLPAHKLIIFVNGCFWHMHKCKRGRSTPVTNAEFWKAKRERTQIRDSEIITTLRRMHWRVLVLWECQTKDRIQLVNRLNKILKKNASDSPRKITTRTRSTKPL